MVGPLKKILVPTDGSKGSESVFPAIMPLVRAFDPEVALLYVFEHPESVFVPPEEVSSACRALRTAHVNASLELRDGKPAEEILRLARARNVDLIAMSTQGRGGLVRFIAGSVAEEVLRHTDIPMLLTRPDVPVKPWKHIAVALDGSDRAEEILPDVVRLARTLRATVEVIEVEFPSIAGVAGEVAIPLPTVDPMPYLNGVVARLQSQGVEASAVALEGSASGELLKQVRSSGAALLCMTTHGRSGLSRLLLGSVAEEIVRKAPCPVLLRRTVESLPVTADLLTRGTTAF
jgi:nucleotide-binding universal stress UspA family protein